MVWRGATWILVLLPLVLAGADAGDAVAPEISDRVGDARPTRSGCTGPEGFDITSAYFEMPDNETLLARLGLQAFVGPVLDVGVGTQTPCHWAVVWSSPQGRFAARFEMDPLMGQTIAWLSEFQDVDGPDPYPMFRDIEEINATLTTDKPARITFEIPAALVLRDGTYALERPFALTFTAPVEDDERADLLWTRHIDDAPELIDRAPDCRVGNVTCTAWGADFISPFHAPPVAEEPAPSAVDAASPAAENGTHASGVDAESASVREDVQPMETQAASAVPWWANEVAQATVGLVGLVVSALAALLAFLRVRRRRDLVARLLRRIESANTENRERPADGASVLGGIREDLRLHLAKRRIEDGQFLELDRRAAGYQTGLRLRLVDSATPLPPTVRDAVRAALADGALHDADVARIRPMLEAAPIDLRARGSLLAALEIWARTDRALVEAPA